MTKLRLIATAALGVICALPLAAQYTIVDLGTLGGTSSGSAAINNNGQVVGGSATAGDVLIHAFSAQPGKNPLMVDLGTFGGIYSQATAINATGAVSGVTVMNGRMHAIYFKVTATDIGTLGGSAAFAYGLNDSGMIAGYSAVNSDAAAHAFLYSGGKMADLGTLGGKNSAATALNNAGTVVGHSNIASATAVAPTHAFVYVGGTMTDLGTLGGTNSWANAISNTGYVVGNAETLAQGTHAFVVVGGKMRDLGTLGGPNSTALAINDRGQVVGSGDELDANSDWITNAFIYNGRQLVNLNTMIPPNSGWVLYEARAINNLGQIAGTGSLNGHRHAFLLSPPGFAVTAAATANSQGGTK